MMRGTRTRTWGRVIRRANVAGALLLGLSVANCGTDPAAPNALQPDPLWELGLVSHVAVMSTDAPYDTLRIAIAPRHLSGTLAEHIATPTFQVSDGSISVDANGVIHAIVATEGTRVRITLRDTVTGETLTDSLRVIVRNGLPSHLLGTLSIDIPPGDSAVVAVPDVRGYSPPGKILQLQVHANDGTDITNDVPVVYTSSDSSAASVDASGFVTAHHAGRPVSIVVATTFYGVTRVDSVVLAVRAPYVGTVDFVTSCDTCHDGHFVPDTVRIGVNGTIVFGIDVYQSFAVEFADPTHVAASTLEAPSYALFVYGSGNIPTLPGLFACVPDVNGLCIFGAPRSFPVVGTYGFRDPISGATGAVIVRPRE